MAKEDKRIELRDVAGTDNSRPHQRPRTPSGDVSTPIEFRPSTVAEPKELRGWYMFDWANSVYSTVIISGYLPLLLQSTALAAAGFPDLCPNVRQDAGLAHSLFPGDGVDSVYLLDSLPTTSCEGTSPCTAVNGTVYCPGLPSVVPDCRSADGAEQHRVSVSFGAFDMDPTAYASTFIGISVFFQALTFLSVSALGDFGDYRKRLLVITSTGGAVASLFCLAVVPDTWWLGGILTIVSNVLYGATFIFYNSYLPILAAAHPEVMNADPAERDSVRARVEESMSSTGYAAGYVGAVLLLIVCIGISFFIPGTAAYRVNIGLAGAWWLFFSFFSFRVLKTRPGPELPAGNHSYVLFSWRRAWRTLRNIRQLPRTFTLLLCWFCYSDGFTVISSLGALFANSQTDWGCFPKTLGLGLVFLEVPIFAAVGCVAVDKLSARYQWTAKKIIVSVIVTYFVLGGYTMLGFVTDSVGLKHGWELFIFGFVYGLGLGVIQSYSRALFSSLVPPGLEGEFFGFFEITDKGSSWMGPVVIGVIQQLTGELRYGIFYIFFMMALPLPFLLCLDVDAGRREARAHSKKARDEDLKDPALMGVVAPTPVRGSARSGKNAADGDGPMI